jgi:hypothetical protein
MPGKKFLKNNIFIRKTLTAFMIEIVLEQIRLFRITLKKL